MSNPWERRYHSREQDRYDWDPGVKINGCVEDYAWQQYNKTPRKKKRRILLRDKMGEIIEPPTYWNTSVIILCFSALLALMVWRMFYASS